VGRDLGKQNVSVRRQFADQTGSYLPGLTTSIWSEAACQYLRRAREERRELTSLLDHFESGAKEDPWCSTFQYSEVNLEEDDEQGALAQHQSTLKFGRNAEAVPLLGLGDEGLDIDRDHA
jgi:hypothetical protein